MKIKSLLLVFLFSSAMLNLKADKRNILFIGNSYTYVNTLPQVLVGLAGTLGDTVTHDSSTPGGYTAQLHANNTTTLTKIAQGNWDHVTIQCQSQEPSFATAQVDAQTYPFVMQLDSTIQASNSCAETLFYMTWGRKVGDLSNYPNDTYDAMQSRLRFNYLRFADSAQASVSPVGAAWKVMRDSFPNIDLYAADGSHPSVHGTYLAACVFYCTIFKKSCVAANYTIGGVSGSDAFIMRQIADKVVLDSLEIWHSKGSIPDADYNYSAPSTTFSISFLNSSKRYTSCNWDFGDGSPINNALSPNHTFPSSGPFTVCMEAISTCGKKDSICQSVVAGPNLTSSFSATDKIKITQQYQHISITNDFGNCTAKLLDMNGKSIRQFPLLTGSNKISLHEFATGIYLLQIKKNNNLVKLKKIYHF